MTSVLRAQFIMTFERKPHSPLCAVDTLPDPETVSDSTRYSISEDRKRMKILLVSPEAPITYWSHDHTMDIIGKKTAIAPLGLMTLSGMLPKEWDLDLADLNTGKLDQDRIERADAVFLGGMHIQAKSFHEQAERAKQAGKLVVGGGPYVTTSPNECSDLDHLVIGEVEGGIDEWGKRFEQGTAPEVATMPPFPKLDKLPKPRYELIKPEDYFSMSLQLSRGCPHDCDFCSVTKLNGRMPRLKSADQFLNEAEAIRQSGFRGSTFVVDDNFIGNRKAVEEMLPKIASWQRANGHPLDFYTQADIRIAKYDDLMKKMVEAGFSGVFLGIETPSKEALEASGKHQNARIDLDEAVKKIAEAGLEPMAGFIMGFDSDTEEGFAELKSFIKRNPMPQAMIGLLQAVPNTELRKKMEEQGRMRSEFDGDQFGNTNFETVMDAKTLRSKYGEILKDIYEPKAYFKRCLQLMGMNDVSRHSMLKYRPGLALKALKNSLLKQGICSEYRGEYWKFLVKVATTMPGKMSAAITHAIKLDHLYRYTHEHVLPGLA